MNIIERERTRDAAGSKLVNPLLDIQESKKELLESLVIETNTLKNESTYHESAAHLSQVYRSARSIAQVPQVVQEDDQMILAPTDTHSSEINKTREEITLSRILVGGDELIH